MRTQRSAQGVSSARAHKSIGFFRSAHAQGGRTKRFSIVNFSKSSRTTYAQILIFLNIRQHRSSDNFSSKSVGQILRYSSIPNFDIFVEKQKPVLHIFVLTCKNAYFDPKFKW